MWLIVPLIYLLSWRSHRRFDQALNETFAWTLGYLGTAGLILITDLGGVGMFSTKPTDPGAAIAILGGFVGMYVSRFRWRRRGGHLKPNENRWTRAFAAARSGQDTPAKPAQRKAASTTSGKATTVAKSPAPATKAGSPAQRKSAQPSTAYRLGRAFKAMTDGETRPSQAPKPPAAAPRSSSTGTTAQATSAKRPSGKPKPSSNRWARAFGAMLDDGKGTKRSS